MNTYVIMWLAVFALTLILEFSTAALVCIWFMPSAIVCAILAGFNAHAFIQFITFFALSVVLLILFRTPLSIYIYSRKKDKLTNLDLMIGAVGRVEEEIDNFLSKGRVNVNSQSWSARSADNKIISIDSAVVVEKIEGVKLICRCIENGEKELIN